MEIVVPKLGLTMESALLLAWLVEEGTYVQEGEPIAEIATDKIDHEIEAPASGVLTNLHSVSDDDELAIGTVIGIVTPG